MSRRFYHPAYAVSVVTGYVQSRSRQHNSVIVKGCGFNQARAIVDELGIQLYSDPDALRHEVL